MSATTFSIDLNAHITDISCEITLEDGKPIAHISFCNVGPRAITAVKFKAAGFNSFGDVISVNGDNVFSLVIQDIRVEPNAQAEVTFKDLPNTDIRKLDLVEDQVCFPDGSVDTYNGENKRDIEIEKILPEEVGQEEYKALQDKFGDYLYYPQEIDNYGWICCCGKYNSKDVNRCPQCDNFKSDVFKISEEGFIDQITADYQGKIEKQEEEKKRQDEIAELNEKKQRRKKNTITGVVVAVIAVIIIGLIVWLTVSSSQPRFDSVEDMKASVGGVYSTYIDDNTSPYMQLYINTTAGTVTERYSALGSNSDDVMIISSWDPQSGKIEIDSVLTITVNKDGTLKYLDRNFEKTGRSWSNSSTSSSDSTSNSDSKASSNSYSERKLTATGNGSGPLSVDVSIITARNGQIYCYGEVANNGTKKCANVEVRAEFKDASGTVLDIETYGIWGVVGIAAGDTGSFSFTIDDNTNIVSCTVSVSSYNTVDY